MNSEDKSLLVEAAIAASNHGLRKEAYSLLEIFPQLIEDVEDRCICESLIYFALNDLLEASDALKDCQSDKAKALQFLYSKSQFEHQDTVKFNQLVEGDHDGFSNDI
ncbi:EscG/YscG/SsaH family type III secretion system needle protein co-chaperone [Shewanella surugensis]|uniref:EscG/YscG/SsaH family type III secretion system needle protein co-chaperone n=1 Tax=Shewanella surugensis TaxID=212020 RepID=A0ABT0L7K6_9GAMM|nr:EscG/YscG/SsaH family type III secretion system needle protein co-chaperone [Shewanella surugensis]MCL1123674.1 EscG/YscG/SsaH family type III secretion system needle protein co-chaperone [Shewanella surugensis]